MQGNC